MLKRFIGLLLLSLPLTGIDCRAEETYDSFISLQLENDLWGSNDDRFYTHGSKFSWATNEPAPEFLLSLTERLPFYKSGPTERHGFEIGQAIFTPEDIEATALIEDDRPYASWLYLNTGIGHVYHDRGDRERMNMLLLTIGIVGPSSLGEETQEAVHSVFDNTDPQGWDNQLEDELGLNFTFLSKSRRIYGFDESWQTELGGHNNFTLGNVYSYAAVGVTARFGTHLKNDIGPPSILPGFPGTPTFNPYRKSNWYLFAGLEVRAMLHNIFLDGNTQRDSHSVVKEKWVADIQFGVAYHFNDMRVSFVQLFRSREFESQDEATQYGAINFTFFNG